MADTGEFSKMKINELKKLLKEQGLPISGNKPDLIARLLKGSSGDSTEVTGAAAVGEMDDSLLNEEDEDLKAIEAELDKTDDLNLDSTLDKSEENLNLANTPEKGLPKKKSLIEPPGADETASHKSVSLAKTLTESEKLALRAQKYGVVSEDAKKELRAKKFGTEISVSGAGESKTSSRDSKSALAGGVSIQIGDIDRLKKRAERFGSSVSPSMDKLKETEKQLKRQERFGGTTSENNFEKKQIKLADNDKKSDRAARFGLSDTASNVTSPSSDASNLTSKSSDASNLTSKSSDEEKRRKRTQKFGAVTSMSEKNTDSDERKKKRLERFN